MLGFEVRKILLILLVLGRFLVLRHLCIVLLLNGGCLLFEGFAYGRIKHLPPFAHKLCNLSERKVLTLQLLANFCCR